MSDEKDEFEAEFSDLARSSGIEADYTGSYYNLLFELATGLASRHRDGLLTVGISGAQGTGKSTFARLLAVVLERIFEKNTLVVSMDDFYYTRAERKRLAARVHPLLQTRGVPGTHDVALMRSVVSDLKARRNTEVPTLSKGDDDRSEMVPVMGGALDVLIVEGWCWGATPGADASLQAPVNTLEELRDPGGQWRRYVNQQLKSGGYRELFAEADTTYFLAAPDFEAVFHWRWQQERGLTAGARVMNEEQVREFVMFYQRITERMLRDMPNRASLTMFLDDRHRVRAPRRDEFQSRS